VPGLRRIGGKEGLCGFFHSKKKGKMKFQKAKKKREIMAILGRYLDGSEDEFEKCAKAIVAIIETEHKEKVNALIRADSCFYF